MRTFTLKCMYQTAGKRTEETCVQAYINNLFENSTWTGRLTKYKTAAYMTINISTDYIILTHYYIFNVILNGNSVTVGTAIRPTTVTLVTLLCKTLRRM